MVFQFPDFNDNDIGVYLQACSLNSAEVYRQIFMATILRARYGERALPRKEIGSQVGLKPNLQKWSRRWERWRGLLTVVRGNSPAQYNQALLCWLSPLRRRHRLSGFKQRRMLTSGVAEGANVRVADELLVMHQGPDRRIRQRRRHLRQPAAA